MNYLAHIYLSGEDPDIQIGGLLGDFVKGPLRSEYPEKIEAGIHLHRKIDTLTDAHPLFLERLMEFQPPWRRFGGILLDIYFDHLLASRWREFHDNPLHDYCQMFYQHLDSRHSLLPERARQFSLRAPQVRWLENYANQTMIPTMLDNLGKRLKRPIALGDAWPELLSHHRAVETAFDAIMNHHQITAREYLQDNL